MINDDDDDSDDDEATLGHKTRDYAKQVTGRTKADLYLSIISLFPVFITCRL
jgi:hypothetical protein